MWQTLAEAWSYVSGHIEAQQTGAVYLISTLFVGGAGAYWGALGAQRIVSREANRKVRRDAILAANAAQSLTVVVFNQAAGLKKQHHLPKLEVWRKQRETFIGALAKRDREVVVGIHFETPPPISFPITRLSEIVYEKLPLNGRPLAALSELVQAEHTLTYLLNEHQSLRIELEQREQGDAVERYLALDTPRGRDDRYKDLVEGFINLLDDLIFFSDVLGKDLMQYGNVLRDQAPNRERKKLPQVNEPGKLLPENEYLIPKHPHHAKWLERHKMIWPPQKVLFLKSLWPFGKTKSSAA
jgi:hypothetical protein